MRKKDFKEFMPSLILIGTFIYSLIIVTTSNTVYSTKHYFGFLFAVVSIICFFINRKVYEYLMGITLIVGTIGLIAFTPSIYSISLIGIGFHPYSLMILIIYLIILKNKYNFSINS